MHIVLNGTKIMVVDTKVIGFQLDNLVTSFSALVDTTSDWSYKLDISYNKPDCNEPVYNVIELARVGNECSVTLTDEMFPFSGKWSAQLRGINGNKVYHSDIFEIWCKKSIDPSEVYDPVPSEFYQIEANITELNNHPPYPGPNGYWMIYNPTTKTYEESTILNSTALPAISATTNGKFLTNNGSVPLWGTGAGGTSNFDELNNRPKYNSTTMSHETNIPEVKTAVWDAKQAELVSGTNIKTINNQSVLGSGNIQIDGVTNFDQLTNRPSYNGTAMTHTTNIPEVKTTTWDAKYDKPSGGIPSTDMSTAVQTSLGKADTALQEHQSLAAYRTSSDQDIIDATLQPKTDNSLTTTAKTVVGAINEHESDISQLSQDKVDYDDIQTSVSSSSTDAQVPSAKLFYDTVGTVEATLNAIRGVS